MNVVIGLLAVIAMTGLYAAVSGDPRVLTIIGGHAYISQIIAFFLASVALVAAYGCWNRRMYGWYLVTGLIGAELVWRLFRAIYLALTLDLPWLGTLLGGIGELVKIGAVGWLLVSYWFKQRGKFQGANHLSTSPAGRVPGSSQTAD